MLVVHLFQVYLPLFVFDGYLGYSPDFVVLLFLFLDYASTYGAAQLCWVSRCFGGSSIYQALVFMPLVASPIQLLADGP